MISKEQLEGFQQVLLTKKAEIEKEIADVSHPSLLDGESVPDYEEVGREFGDDAAERENFQRNAVVLRSLEDHLLGVNAALDRIEKGVYGVSVYSGKEIPLKRLEAYPEARGLADEEE